MAQPKWDGVWVILLFILFIPTTLLIGCGGSSASAQRNGASYQAIVTPPAAGIGTVISTPPGIDCPPTCSASFAQYTVINLSAKPSSGYFFGGWNGSCSGTSNCSLLMDSAENVAPIFTSARTGKNVVAYVFTPDAVQFNSTEFALLSDGELQATAQPAKPLILTGTAHGLVSAVLPVRGQSTSTLQSYSLKQNGSLQPQGPPLTVASNQYVSLTSDQTYVYAATDVGVFGFIDASTGLSALPAIQQPLPPPAPCSSAQENANVCRNTGLMMLGNANAFLLQTWTGQNTAQIFQLTSFSRSQGQLTAELYVAGKTLSTGVFAPTPDGNFIYALDLASNRIVRYSSDGNGAYEANVLSDGQQLSDDFIQLIISADEAFLFAPVSGPAKSPRIRVFRIDALSGALTEVPGSPFLTGEYYMVAAALDPTGHFLLAAHSYCDGSPPCMGPGKLVAMSIDSTSGAMSVTSDVDDGQDPFTVAAAAVSH
jgi:Divergent InlB B-repeat domain